jgi:HEPN domain-containing protein
LPPHASDHETCRKSSAAVTVFLQEFTPAMVKAVLDELKKTQPKNHFTVGIIDDVATSLEVDPQFITGADRVVARCSSALAPTARGREQELHQDHRLGNRQLRASATSL